MDERREVERTAYSEDWVTQDWIPLDGFLAALRDAVAGVPEEYRSTARFGLCYANEDGALLEVRYVRPETDAEMAERLDQDRQREDRRRRDEMAMLARLKAKYEGEGRD